MGFSGTGGGVLRAILGRRRGANRRFYRGIPGFLGGARVRRGDSAHSRRCRALGAKKFLKTFKKGVENRKIGVREGSGGGGGASYIGRAGRGEAGFRFGHETSSSVARGVLRAGISTTGARHEISEIRSSIYREGLFASSIAHFMGHLCLSGP